MKIFDTFLFFNELDLLELRLHTLAPVVDYFVLTEATETFSGRRKQLVFGENRERFAQFLDRIVYNPITRIPHDFHQWQPPNAYYTDRTKSYPSKSAGVPLEKLSPDFQREVFQRDSIIGGLLGRAADEDVVLISDLDEIPNPAVVDDLRRNFREDVYVCCQKWFMYYLNVVCEREWFGTRACRFNHLRGRSVDLMRVHLESRADQSGYVLENAGWHFSFLGGPERVREKLAAYSYQGRRSQCFLRLLDRVYPGRIEQRIQDNEDIFLSARRFTPVKLDDSFPRYLLEHRDRFAHLIKPLSS